MSGGRSCGSLRVEAGQVMPLAIGLIGVLAALAMIAVAFGGSLTGKARAQRVADLAAVSAASSLRDDLPRRLSPATVNGVPNPFHMTRGEYLGRARQAAVEAADANGASDWRVSARFPDFISPAPLTVKVALITGSEVEVGGERSVRPVSVDATAAVKPRLPGLSGAGGTVQATGGGYSGTLEVRQGKGMRPDVAQAFDQLAAAALADGHSLVVNSAFRSDAEQARLFAANPDPMWVAPPGTSLHRCATELDIGPESAYDWLAGNAERFGFSIRYSWEPWHLGFVNGPEPCSAAGDLVSAGGGDGLLSGASMPDFVPAKFRGMIRDAAARWDVPAELLAAQLKAESNFDPGAVSHAGAQGIAQFMPGTASEYGLLDPFDPRSAILAQAEMMSELLGRFGSVELALAAYNAGPGAVGGCECIPDFPETIAYVEKIVGMLSGISTGSTFSGIVMEVALID